MASTTYGTGTAGDLLINAIDSIEATGAQPITNLFSGLTSGTLGAGNAGNIVVNTQRLTLRDGGTIDSSTLSSGAAGNLTINATESVEIAGTGLGGQSPSQITSSANILDIAFQQLYHLPMGFPSGNSGDVIINTGRLSVTDGGLINVKNKGTGDAGTIRIAAQPILLDRQGSITASTQSGEGGNIFLQGRSLVMRDNSSIVATAGGTGNGGNITIAVPVIVGLENSDIIANAVKGRGGNIDITTQGIFGLKYRDQLTPENDITASSEFGVNGTVDIATPGIDPNSGLLTLPVVLVDPSQHIAQGCAAQRGSSFVITGRGGMADNPTNQFTLYRPWADLRSLTPDRHTGAQTPPALVTSPPLVEATGWRRNADGSLELFAAAPPAPVSPTLPATCAHW